MVKKFSKNLVINLADTAVQERYQLLTQSYYKGSNGVIDLVDADNKRREVIIEEGKEK